MDAAHAAEPSWWNVVRAMAGFVMTGYDEQELTETYVKQDLMAQGFAEQEIFKAFEWVEKAMVSGHLSECLAMLQPQTSGLRIANPLETVCLSENLWSRIELCRHKGLLSNDLIERLLEGVRVLDTRDWDDEEVSVLLAELLSTVLPNSSEQKCLEILEGRVPEFYC